MKLWPGWLVVLAAACGLGSTGTEPATSNLTLDATRPAILVAGGAMGEANAHVVRVVDGDTIDAEFDGRTERVRLIGIDTPETLRPDTPVECYGPEATATTTRLLPAGTPLVVVRDLEARDDYGRLLAYVYRAPDGLFVNLDLVEKGFA